MKALKNIYIIRVPVDEGAIPSVFKQKYAQYINKLVLVAFKTRENFISALEEVTGERVENLLVHPDDFKPTEDLNFTQKEIFTGIKKLLSNQAFHRSYFLPEVRGKQKLIDRLKMNKDKTGLVFKKRGDIYILEKRHELKGIDKQKLYDSIESELDTLIRKIGDLLHRSTHHQNIVKQQFDESSNEEEKIKLLTDLTYFKGVREAVGTILTHPSLEKIMEDIQFLERHNVSQIEFTDFKTDKEFIPLIDELRNRLNKPVNEIARMISTKYSKVDGQTPTPDALKSVYYKMNKIDPNKICDAVNDEIFRIVEKLEVDKGSLFVDNLDSHDYFKSVTQPAFMHVSQTLGYAVGDIEKIYNQDSND